MSEAVLKRALWALCWSAILLHEGLKRLWIPSLSLVIHSSERPSVDIVAQFCDTSAHILMQS